MLARARATGRTAFIADVKLRSPRHGQLIAPERLEGYVVELTAAGVDAMSTPTDPVHFGGSLEVAALIRRLCEIPLVRKEFFTNVAQMDESRRAGFDAVQLSANTMPREALHAMMARARQLGLEVMIGIRTAAHLRLAVEVEAETVVVNNRDISVLELDDGAVGASAPLLASAHRELFVISASGLLTPPDMAAAAAAGADAVMVGTALARSADPAALIADFRGLTAQARVSKRNRR